MKIKEYLTLTAKERAERLARGSGGLDTKDSTLEECQEARALQMAAFDRTILNDDSEHREIHADLVYLAQKALLLAEKFMSDTERQTAISVLCYGYSGVYKNLINLEPDGVDCKRHRFLDN